MFIERKPPINAVIRVNMLLDAVVNDAAMTAVYSTITGILNFTIVVVTIITQLILITLHSDIC